MSLRNSMIVRILFFTALLLIGLMLPWYFVLFGMLAYVFVYRGYEVLFVGVLLDAQFGISSFSLVYTSISAGMLVVAEFVKPHIVLYEREL